MPFDDEVKAALREQARHTGQDVEFGPFDVDLHDIDVPFHEIVERRDVDRGRLRHRGITAFGKQAVDGADVAAQVELPPLAATAGGPFDDRHVSKLVATQVVAQHPNIVGRRLHRDDPARGADGFRAA